MSNAKYLDAGKTSIGGQSNAEMSSIKEYAVVNTTIDPEDDIDNDLKPEN